MLREVSPQAAVSSLLCYKSIYNIESIYFRVFSFFSAIAVGRIVLTNANANDELLHIAYRDNMIYL